MHSYPKKLKPLDLTLHEKFKYIIPNGKLSGSTWDAKHLDNFLQDNTRNYKFEYYQRKKEQLDNKNLTLLSAGTAKSKENCIFHSKPRFTDNYLDYTLNNFPQFFTELSSLALPQQKNNSLLKKIETLPTIEDSYLHKAQMKEFDEKKLEPLQFPKSTLSSSKEKRSELFDLQKNRKEYSKWKLELANLTKKKRILQNGFRSGAMNIDNPLNDQSFYYKEISQELKRKNDNLLLREEKHRNFLDGQNKTNENIGFSNRYAAERTKTEDIAIFDEKKHKNINDFWNVKKKNSVFANRNKGTGERVFGSENLNYFLDRAVFLRDEDARQKKYNIVTLNYYDPEIKPDNFKKIRGKTSLDFDFQR